MSNELASWWMNLLIVILFAFCTGGAGFMIVHSCWKLIRHEANSKPKR